MIMQPNFLGEFDDVGKRRAVAVHAEHRVRDDDFFFCFRCGNEALEVGHVAVAVAMELAAGQSRCRR